VSGGLAAGLRRVVRPPATAVVVPVPAAAAVVGEPYGPSMPPHVTVLWPFARRPGRRHRRALAEIAASQRAFPFALTRVGTFPGVVYLAPEPAAPFVDLVQALSRRWPRHQPYSGAFDEVVPHVTVRLGAPATGDELTRLQAALPIEDEATALVLLAPHGDGWREVYRAPFRAASSA
jgi:2'-5' RNA ligase